jgi:hypothetical protein
MADQAGSFGHSALCLRLMQLFPRVTDPADRRRTIIPGQATVIGHWLDGAARPLARVLDKLTPGEQEAFLKAMDLLETELRRQDTGN